MEHRVSFSSWQALWVGLQLPLPDKASSSTQANNAAYCSLYSTLGRTSFQENIKHKEGSQMTLRKSGLM